VDGIITFLQPTKEISQLAVDYQKPILLLGKMSDSPNIDYICTDDNVGGGLAASKLVENGCNRFLYVTEKLEDSDCTNNCAKSRLDGFVGKLQELSPNSKCDIIERNDKQTFTQLVQEYANTHNIDKSLGIFCFNDIVAFEVLSTLDDLGKNAYTVGYDNIQAEIKMPNRLATIGSDKKQMAKIAAEVVVFKIHNPQKFEKSFQKCHEVFFVDGATC